MKHTRPISSHASGISSSADIISSCVNRYQKENNQLWHTPTGKIDLLQTLCYDGRTVLIISGNWEPDLAVGNSDSTAASSETEQDPRGELSGTDGLRFLSLSHCINSESMIGTHTLEMGHQHIPLT
jgi:hypothetical protein